MQKNIDSHGQAKISDWKSTKKLNGIGNVADAWDSMYMQNS